MDVVVVESPAKAKTINKYLGDQYKVIASYGHIRDLPPKDGSVRPDEDFAMDWAVDARSEKQIKAIVDAVKNADGVILATDPDREGEAISWHVLEELKRRRALKDKAISRVTFNEITKRAVQEAMANPRDLNRELIEAYLARRALDYLVGFTLSPVLWRKLPGSRSAGRVQSVALRLICEREAEIEIFKPQEYWSVEAAFETAQGAPFTARLTHFNGDKLDRLSLKNEAEAKAAVEAVGTAGHRVVNVETKTLRRNPYPPFTTSTLQQEASRKLGLSASRTMQIAQKLYEGITLGGETVGLITYMRTDGVQLSGEAIGQTRHVIEKDYGGNYLPKSPRVYKTKQKNAQEAHEAIRPTDLNRRPAQVAQFLDRDQQRLYDLIWKRTLACQMESAVVDQTGADIEAPGGRAVLRATGQVIKFDGFLTLYTESRDDNDAPDEEKRLPAIAKGDTPTHKKTTPEQHFTQPPPRYTEASLVKKLEELGIGRPSTYASILQVLQDRNYVVLDKRRFQPEDRGRLVTVFLTNFFNRYVGYDFTANLEQQLDDVSGGRLDWRTVLQNFWSEFSKAVDETKGLTITEVLDALDAELGAHFFPTKEDGSDGRVCRSCGNGRLGLRLGKHGAFIGCSNYPECRFTRPLAVEGDGEADAALGDGGIKELGQHSVTQEPVSLRKGPYGFYVQLGDGEKPKRTSIPRDLQPQDITLDSAVALLDLPRDVGPWPENGEMIQAGIGRFGPYVRSGKLYQSIPKGENVLEIGINRAIALMEEAKAKAPKEIGAHPEDSKPIMVARGRFGPYVEWDGVRANVPRGTEATTVTLEMAIDILNKKVEKDGGKKAAQKASGKKAASKKTTAKKTTAKKTTAEKPAANKTTAKKITAKKTATAKSTGTDG
ncbi:MAG: type I DNA topoisomerase [Alphaproteobacteria bacterium]|nr:type I DNA topoisomerase [Alphaproteobacteria bacterium]